MSNDDDLTDDNTPVNWNDEDIEESICDFCDADFIGTGYACSDICEAALREGGEPTGPEDIDHDSTDGGERGGFDESLAETEADDHAPDPALWSRGSRAMMIDATHDGEQWLPVVGTIETVHAEAIAERDAISHAITEAKHDAIKAAMRAAACETCGYWAEADGGPCADLLPSIDCYCDPDLQAALKADGLTDDAEGDEV